MGEGSCRNAQWAAPMIQAGCEDGRHNHFIVSILRLFNGNLKQGGGVI